MMMPDFLEMCLCVLTNTYLSRKGSVKDLDWASIIARLDTKYGMDGIKKICTNFGWLAILARGPGNQKHQKIASLWN